MANSGSVQQDVVSFWNSTPGKSFRAFLYVAVSSAVSLALASLTKSNATTVVLLTPFVNTALVWLKNWLDGSNAPAALKLKALLKRK